MKIRIVLFVMICLCMPGIGYAQSLLKTGGTSNAYESVTGSTPKIGIGITNPSSKLHVYHDISNGTGFKIETFEQKGGVIYPYGSLESFVSKNGQMYGLYQSNATGKEILNYLKSDLQIGNVKIWTEDGSRTSGIALDSNLSSFDFSLAAGSGPAVHPLLVDIHGITVNSKVTTSEFQLLSNPGLNYVLLSDAEGNASWADPGQFNLSDDDWFFNDAGDLFTTAPKVGICTRSPRAKLEVNLEEQDSTIYGIILNQMSDYANTYEIRFDRNQAEEWAIGSRNWGDTMPAFFIWNEARGGSALFIEKESGNIGIDTHWPNAKLDVKGSAKTFCMGINTNPPDPESSWKLFVEGGIKAREVLVTVQDFADFVFSDKYSLLPIYELDQFIAKNKHLPGIPSADEVQKNEGIELGSMQVKLLEKIEEQALYIIDLQKQLDELKQTVNSMKEERP